MRSSESATQNPVETLEAMNSALRAVQWAADRVLSVGYGVVYDFIVERFGPYRELHAEVLAQVAAGVSPGANRRDIRVLDVGCGPGNFTCMLAEAGFDTVGLDHYQGLIDLAREKRLAKHLPNLAFRYGNLYKGRAFPEGSFDQVVNVHSLYVHPSPQQLLEEAFRVLKPGGHAVFVNFSRRVRMWPTVSDVWRRKGAAAVKDSLLWVFPNAVFEAMRKRSGPHYWGEEEFQDRLRSAGFTVLDVRRTFFEGVSILVWARRGDEREG